MDLAKPRRQQASGTSRVYVGRWTIRDTLISGSKKGKVPMMRALRVAAAALLWAAAAADEETHTYEDGEHVLLWLNKVGPYHNPQETYSYYKLPFCKPAHIEDQPVRKFPGPHTPTAGAPAAAWSLAPPSSSNEPGPQM